MHFLCAHTVEVHCCFVGSCPFPLQGKVAFYHLPKIIVEEITIITLPMAYFNYLPWVVIRNGLNKKERKVFQTNLFIVHRKQEK